MENYLFAECDLTEEINWSKEQKTMFTTLGQSPQILKQGTLYTSPTWESKYAVSIAAVRHGLLLFSNGTGQIKSAKSLKWKILKPLTFHPNFSGALFGFQISGPKSFMNLYCYERHEFEQWWDTLADQMFMTDLKTFYKTGELLVQKDPVAVHKGWSRISGFPIAITTIQKEKYLADAKMCKALAQEISMLQTVDCDEIVRLRHMFDTRESIQLVSTLPYKTLANKIAESQGYDEQDAAIVITKILRALVHLNKKNIMHRDINLENIQLKSEEKDTSVMLSGFSQATVSTLGECIKQCGTPGYIAPEILQNKRYGSKVDIFSAGVVLYAVLCGKLPFDGATDEEKIVKTQECEVEFLGDRWADISPDAIELIKSMINKDPTQRPSAAEALCHPWLTGEQDVPGPIKLTSLSSLADAERLLPIKTKSISSMNGTMRLQPIKRTSMSSIDSMDGLQPIKSQTLNDLRTDSPTSPSKPFPGEMPQSASQSSSSLLANLTSQNRRHNRPSVTLNLASSAASQQKLGKSQENIEDQLTDEKCAM